MAEPEKVNLASMDIAEEKREQLKALFPEAFTEGKVDFEQLKRVLEEWVEPGKERFGLNWPGKAERMKIIQQPSVATLKPARDESVNFDDTENLFIEGDNLEVLKLLQKSYFGKVKMIYIDPPYNTGKEFIYPDKFAETLDTYLEYTGQKDSEGRKFSTNTDAQGRYHSNWLNMMYPRLYLARNLLREDGVIFISIDDNEQSNLKALCDLIFGEENFAGIFPWRSRTAKADVPFGVSVDVEWVICYARSAFIAGRSGERKYYESDDYKDRWRLFVKLPRWFKIDTPIGPYNPDWAFMTHRDETLYFVRETKSTLDSDERRNKENQKILYGKRHFDTIGVDYDVVTKLADVAF